MRTSEANIAENGIAAGLAQRVGNPIRSFDALTEQSLGLYVYGLIDPKAAGGPRVFYVGKGGGRGAGGNSRAFDHLDEAELFLTSLDADNPTLVKKKLNTITDIWRAGYDVDIKIFRYGITSLAEAFHVESGIIDALSCSSNGRPDNDIDGHGVHDHGLLTLSEAIAKGAQPVSPAQACTVYLCIIGPSIKNHGKLPTDEDLYTFTRGDWLLGKEFQPAPGAFSVGFDRDISWSAYSNLRWEVASKGRSTKGIQQVRWRFSGDRLTAGHELLLKDWHRIRAVMASAWSRATLITVKFDGAGKFQIVRGASEIVSKDWHPCVL